MRSQPMTTNRLTDVRQRIRTGRQARAEIDERSMRLLEMGLAVTAIAVVVLLALARG